MQTNIFGEIETYGRTIEQAAKTANVSTATIRNWIKTGYLVPENKPDQAIDVDAYESEAR